MRWPDCRCVAECIAYTLLKLALVDDIGSRLDYVATDDAKVLWMPRLTLHLKGGLREWEQ
jgi:hypothetical protein